jgi:acetyl esterase/lipase
MARLVARLLAWALLLLGVLAFVAWFVTPWPSVLLIRAIFDRGAAEASARLAPHVPPGIRVDRGLAYDPADPDARLDIIRPPAGATAGPTIVWFHGGGFVSGRRADVENYLRVLAGEGFTIANVDYTIAPEAHYPTPIRQANAALGYLTRAAPRLGIDPGRLILAGDSAGAQIAAELANLATAPAYARAVGIPPAIAARQLRGTILFCGPYDLDLMGDGWFARATIWAYGGRRDARADPAFRLMSVARHVTPAFPPSFITAGNGDPLLPHSVALAAALRSRGVAVETLYFPGHQPPLGHEYQFDLDTAPAREALGRATAFARRIG